MLAKQPREQSPSPAPASPSQKEDSPPLTPPPLADSRLYYLRIGVLTKEEFDEVPVNLDLPVDQPDPDRWRLLPPLDTAAATNSRGSSSPVPLTSSLSAGASPYWSRSTSSAHSSPVVQYHTDVSLQRPPESSQNYAQLVEDSSEAASFANSHLLGHVEAFHRVSHSPVAELRTDNSLGLSVAANPPQLPIPVHAPAPIRAYMQIPIVSDPEPTPPLSSLYASAQVDALESPQTEYSQHSEVYRDHYYSPTEVHYTSRPDLTQPEDVQRMAQEQHYPQYHHNHPEPGPQAYQQQSPVMLGVEAPSYNVFDERGYFRRVSNPSIHSNSSSTSYISYDSAPRRRSYPAVTPHDVGGIFPTGAGYDYLVIPEDGGPYASTSHSSPQPPHGHNYGHPHSGWHLQ
ncbi:hypothetical protein C8F01DRAFT_1086247 [Mycena amicta]|nr:hypothetical protein C8F01DRAFT_1086247 [Mycena amicta]